MRKRTQRETIIISNRIANIMFAYGGG